MLAFGPELKKLEVSRTSAVTARPDLSSHRFTTAACDPTRKSPEREVLLTTGRE
jgi:hypothetical protein